jgi:hypothetical protein
MTEDYTLLMIRRRMQALGIGDGYYIKTEHLVLQAGETLEIEADNQFYFLVKDVDNVKIRSDFGFFDLSFSFTNKQDYEHQGTIRIHNYANTMNHIRFIQVIPTHTKSHE